LIPEGGIHCGALTHLYELARSLCIAGAAAAGVAAIETIYPAYRDIDGLRAYAQPALRDGFQGMLAIHPAQVPPINEAFTPTSAESAYAERVVAGRLSLINSADITRSRLSSGTRRQATAGWMWVLGALSTCLLGRDFTLPRDALFLPCR
jgi:hypothetical protein